MNSASKKKALTFQELLFALEDFWAGHGCVLPQPYDLEVGAGTMSPDTFLRVLGPQPIRIAYAQPSRRPADGRYGENPNRLFKHTQLQVILKPPPENVQELYLESLAPSASISASTTSSSRKTTGSGPSAAPGASAGRSCSTARRSPSSPTSSSAAAWTSTPSPARSPTAWSASPQFLQDKDSIYDIVWARDPDHRHGAHLRRGPPP